MAYKIEIVDKDKLVVTDTAIVDPIESIQLDIPKEEAYFDFVKLQNGIVFFYDKDSTKPRASRTFESVVSNCVDLNDVTFTEETFLSFCRLNLGFNTASGGSGVSSLIWSVTGLQEQNVAISEDVDTLVNLIAMPFSEYNSDNVVFSLADNWVDISAISTNSWITIRMSCLGVSGDADVTPSFRLYNDKNDLNTFTEIHGQSSKQKNGKNSSYLAEGFNGGAEVLQFFIQTDKNETLSFLSLSIKIDDVND